MKALALLLLLAACDSRAKAEQKTATPEQKSAEYESCGASLHCKDNLRCFDQTCRRTTRSTVGDYYAQLGASLLAKGKLEESIAAYNQALGQYGAEKVDMPPEIDCGYGTALAAARAKKEHAELGARVLHRCILAVPVGSALREQALGQLTLLAESGLDPILLGPAKTADLYLTKGPAKPATDKLAVTVLATPPLTGKGAAPIVDKLQAFDLRAQYLACWEALNTANGKTVLAVTIGVKSSYYANDDFEDQPGGYTLKFDPAPNLPAGPDATADSCVRAVVEPAIKAMKIAESFTTKLAVTIK